MSTCLKQLNHRNTTSPVVHTVIKDFNLLATTYRRTEAHARSELRYLLEQVGDPTAVVDRTGISGVIVAKTTLDPFEAIKKLREILQQRPYEFRYTLRIIPIERTVSTTLDQIQDVTKELSQKIAENETFRVTVEKRFTEMHSSDLIEAVAVNIKRKVNLSQPDNIVLIEILGKVTGVSIAKSNEIMSVLKEKIL
jgi:tRNA acetyltransferase TAN1